LLFGDKFAIAASRLILFKTNYPLKSTAPYAPTSEKECISELEYEQYMQDYINTFYLHKVGLIACQI
jgi:hypothetical protein